MVCLCFGQCVCACSHLLLAGFDYAFYRGIDYIQVSVIADGMFLFPNVLAINSLAPPTQAVTPISTLLSSSMAPAP